MPPATHTRAERASSLQFEEPAGVLLGRLDWSSGELRFSGLEVPSAGLMLRFMGQISARALDFNRGDGSTAATLDWRTGKLVATGSIHATAQRWLKWVRLAMCAQDPVSN